MKFTRRALLGTAAVCLSAGTAPFASAQGSAWPARPIRLISPYGAGGASDISARILAEYLGKKLGQQIVVENKPGAGTRLANEFAARAPGDGYTILYAAAPYATAEALYGRQNFDTRKDLQPVALVAMAPLFLIVNAQSGIKTAQELIAHSKTKPSGLNIASPGAGSQPNLAAELFLRDGGARGVVIHYRGDAPAYAELLAGRVDATLTAITTALPHIQAGKLRVLGVAATQRSALYPDAPTLREQGFPNVVASGWYGFMVPGTTPPAIVERLQLTTIRALADPEVKQKFLAQGLEPNSKTSAEFRKFIDDEGRKWGELIAKAGIKGE
ncbi:tripartite tricarboxylate transporter substrate binding protein [Caenimonas sedimenti]|uniref:Tripartite tricarboxylate transporter substrate binding protein n=1 Tax=Caenimonas sedimenti TaxID=2596921 RepID=A0A562ZL51_9BURK|nr:tripartite tricarboxylate transporter substrate binding protein [Caenimonas sedimenti]TWO68904.1 tripartite tricarboxylate transporter substrate binding protein [Caenimonas sedimenti]